MKRRSYVTMVKAGERIPAVVTGFGVFGYIEIQTITGEAWSVRPKSLSEPIEDERQRMRDAQMAGPTVRPGRGKEGVCK